MTQVKKVSTNLENLEKYLYNTNIFLFLGIDKSVFKKENDWWVESGGPPVTNEGKITTDLGLDQYPGKPEDQFLCKALKSFMKVFDYLPTTRIGKQQVRNILYYDVSCSGKF